MQQLSYWTGSTVGLMSEPESCHRGEWCPSYEVQESSYLVHRCNYPEVHLSETLHLNWTITSPKQKVINKFAFWLGGWITLTIIINNQCVLRGCRLPVCMYLWVWSVIRLLTSVVHPVYVPPLRLQCLTTCTDRHLRQNVYIGRLCPWCKADSLAVSVMDSTNSRIIKLLFLTNVMRSCSCFTGSALLVCRSCWCLCIHSFTASLFLRDEPSIAPAQWLIDSFVNLSSGESDLLITFIPPSFLRLDNVTLPHFCQHEAFKSLKI